MRIGSVLSSKNLGKSDDWLPLLLPWQEHRSNLALAVDPRVHRITSVAFSNLSTVISFRQMLLTDEDVEDVDPILIGFKANIDLLLPFLEEASYTKSQRRNGLPTKPLATKGSGVT